MSATPKTVRFSKKSIRSKNSKSLSLALKFSSIVFIFLKSTTSTLNSLAYVRKFLGMELLGGNMPTSRIRFVFAIAKCFLDISGQSVIL